jgi:aerobic-type carbon monoxide dehydrogenase small subunit (CoxS/CutS family)
VTLGFRRPKAQGPKPKAQSPKPKAQCRMNPLAETIPLRVVVNGTAQLLDVAPHHTLLRVLRDQLDLTGTKECCAEGECGACTVLLNGQAVVSCLVLAAEVDGGDVLTIEGLTVHGRLDALQMAFVEKGAVQCGFCIPGMIMAAKYLLMRNPNPTVSEIQEGLAGNLCRCAGYTKILESVVHAAKAHT